MKVSHSTVVNILRPNELDPRTDPAKGTWADFLKAHAQGLWQCDFFSKHIVTAAGVRQCFVLAFIHVQSRRVWLSPCTFAPDAPWMVRQAEALAAHAGREGLQLATVLRDRDGRYAGQFDAALGAAGAEVKVLTFRSPNTNAYVERSCRPCSRSAWTSSSPSAGSTWTTCWRYVEHYHHERPHQGKGNERLTNGADGPPAAEGEVLRRERLGGVLRHYYRRAA